MRELVLVARMKIIEDYRRRFGITNQDVPTNAGLWEVIKDEPFTLEMYQFALANQAELVAVLITRIEELEKAHGILKDEGLNRESTEPSGGDVIDGAGASVDSGGLGQAEVSLIPGIYGR